ncbi:streptomycin resistance protein [Rhizobium sp. TH2]|uniref:aminoglycoside phosphotransferase family protein n=1 Tax=Rhizobium sp. TH2 TaxID=2775403 RepID=UPI0021586393|nr:aminoglycoside phosphotransferase family protein [Rhizobium sp. TH2]UVC10758.1 streptomycin resistance protein [Rhizobium sp. TH2]
MDIDAAADLWHLDEIEPVADTPGSLVYRARTPDGGSVVAKLLKQRGMEELAGMDYLAWRRGHGAVSLIARRDNACLLEDAGSMTLEDFRASHGEEAATKVFADILAELHAPSPHPPRPGLTPLARHFRSLTERAAPAHPDHARDLVWAGELARDLLANQNPVIPFHGDLHHENIISQDGTIWRAIDPHGLIGDPAYDVANFFGNPLGRPDITCDTDRILAIAVVTAQVIGCSESKILQYAACHAALSASWSIDGPVSEEDVKDAQDRLGFLKVVRDLLSSEATC